MAKKTIQLQRWTHPTATKDLGPHEGGWVGLDQQGSYEAALWVAHQRALETAKALQSDLRDLEVSEGEDHKLVPAAKVGVSLGLALETGPGLTLEISPGPAPEAGLGIVLGPTVKAALMVTYRAYIPSPQMNLCPEGE